MWSINSLDEVATWSWRCNKQALISRHSPASCIQLAA